jgi:hypothetical protein
MTLTNRRTGKAKKSDEFKQYIGEKITVYFKSPLLVSTDENGNPGMLPFISGYLIDFNENFVRLGDAPDEFTVSIDIEEIVMVKLDTESEVQELLKQFADSGGDAH